MTREDIEKFLGEDWNRLQELISGVLGSDIKLLNDTNLSLLQHRGKQLRPILSLLVARACSQESSARESSLRYAAASELLHNATLLHDDVADKSTMRHGVPTIMSIFGPSAAVLVGDYWLAKAMKMVVEAEGAVNVDVTELFSKTLSNLAEGEMLQLQKAVGCDTTEEDYQRIIYCKTAALFEATCVSAALSVKAPQQYIEVAREYGISLGMAFQMRDDIMDYFGTDIGKPIGVDLKEKKITLPLFGAFKAFGPEKEMEMREMARDIETHPENFSRILEYVTDPAARQYAEARLDEYVRKAQDVLGILPQCREREILKELAAFTASRTI